MSNDPLDEPMDWGPGEPGPTPREYAAQSAKLAEFMNSLPPLANGGPVHGEIKLGLPPKSIRDLFEVPVVSEILEEVRMIRRALEKTPLFIVVPVSGDVDVQAVADALNVLHAEVTAHMHQEAANETRPGSELPE